MIPRLSHGWQIMLADLSLILFIVTASAIDPAPDKSVNTTAAPAAAAQAPAPSQRSEPVAVFRPGLDLDFGTWLAERTADPREQLTIVARYTGRDSARARAAAETLASEAQAAGLAPRIVVEPGQSADVAAIFAFDPAMARNLLTSS